MNKKQVEGIVHVLDRNHIVEAINTYCRAEKEKDRDVWMGLFSEDILHEDPVGPSASARRGKDALGKFWEVIYNANVDLWLTQDVIVCGNEAIAIMACETGPANARRKSGTIVDLFVFNDVGKITNVRAFYKYD